LRWAAAAWPPAEPLKGKPEQQKQALEPLERLAEPLERPGELKQGPAKRPERPSEELVRTPKPHPGPEPPPRLRRGSAKKARDIFGRICYERRQPLSRGGAGKVGPRKVEKKASTENRNMD